MLKIIPVVAAVIFCSDIVRMQDDPEYIVIAPSSMTDQADSYISMYNDDIIEEYRLVSELVLVDSIVSIYPELTPELAVRTYILTIIDQNENFEYLLIFGDEVLVPPIYDFWGTPSDDLYSSEDLVHPEARISTGRIPVSNPAEAENVVGKLRSFLLTPPDDIYKSNILLIADDLNKPSGDPVFEMSHVENSNNLYNILKYKMKVDCLYGTDYQLLYGSGLPTLPGMTSDLISALNSGPGWVNYIGHGNETTLGDELILNMERDLDHISAPEGKLPIWVAGSCDLGHYDNNDCLAENLLLKADGAAAVITTTRLIMGQTVVDYLLRFYNNLAEQISSDGEIRLGDLVFESKLAAGDIGIHLFGDPAMPLMRPAEGVLITSSPDTLHILEQEIVEVDQLGDVNTVLTLLGPEQHILKPVIDDIVLEYDLPGLNIFSREVQNLAEFHIPLDFPYFENATGNFIAITKNPYDPFQPIIHHINNIPVHFPSEISDHDGPIVQFIADQGPIQNGDLFEPSSSIEIILTDSSGINLMGQSGHDILVHFDEDGFNVTELFHYYNSNLDIGQIDFNLPITDWGIHRLQVEAWDNANNRETANILVCVGNCNEPLPVEMGSWRSYTSMLSVQDITMMADTLYAATDGGVFSCTPSENDFHFFNSGETIISPDLRSIHPDPLGRLWLGSATTRGQLQVFSPNAGLLTSLTIPQATELTDLVFTPDKVFLLARTAYQPIVVELRFDSDYLPYFQDSYSNFPEEIMWMQSITAHEDSLYVCTSDGILRGNITDGLLNSPQSWTVMNPGSGVIRYLPGESDIVVTDSVVAQNMSGSFQPVIDGFINIIQAGYDSLDQVFFLLTETELAAFDSTFQLLSGFPVEAPENCEFTCCFTHSPYLYIGVKNGGILKVDRQGEQENLCPDTMFSNETDAVTVNENDGRIAGVNTQGIFIIDEDIITNYICNYETDNYPENQIIPGGFSKITIPYKPGSNHPWSILYSPQDTYLFSNSGILPDQPGTSGGVVELNPVSNEITVFDTSAGILDGLNGLYNPYWTNRYLTVHQINSDPEGNVWILNPYSETYNHMAAVRGVSGEWSHFTPNDSTSYLPQEITFDQFGKAWFGMRAAISINDDLQGYADGGLRVLMPGNEFGIETDDIWYPVLNPEVYPSESIWSLVVDNDNVLWILTSGGIQGYNHQVQGDGVMLFPINNFPILTQIPFYIGDHIRLDSGNNKWVTTKHHGVFIIRPDHSIYPDNNGLTPENSRILSEFVTDIAFNAPENQAIIATDKGISIYDYDHLPDVASEQDGDLNSDGITDVSDLVILIFYLLDLEITIEWDESQADLNHDGISDIVDAVWLINIILSNQYSAYQRPPEISAIMKDDRLLIQTDEFYPVIQLEFEYPLHTSISVSSPAWTFIQNKHTVIAFQLQSELEDKIEIRLETGNHLNSAKFCRDDSYCTDLTVVPEEIAFESVYPNPFNPVIQISVLIPETGIYCLSIYNLTGRLVDQIFQGNLDKGRYQFSWYGTEVASGLYFLVLEDRLSRVSRKIILLK